MRQTACVAILLMAAMLALLAGVAPRTQSAPPTPVRLALQWNHQAQFAGYYAALDRGLYAAEGLDVTLLQGGPGQDPVGRLRSGDADVATLWLSSALVARDSGLPLVLLAQVANRSSLTLVAWKDRGICAPKDLEGRRVSLWGEPHRSPFLALFAAEGVKPVVVPQYYSPELFLRRGVDACAAMRYNEVHRIYQAGVDPEEVTVLSLGERGFGLPEDGLYCMEGFAAAAPGTCRAFAQASLEGWRAAARAPEEALASVMKRARAAHVPVNEAHQRWMLKCMLEVIFPPAQGGWTAGELSPRDYDRGVRALTGQGLIGSAPSYEEFTGKGAAHAP